MERTPGSDPPYPCSSNPTDTSENREKTVSPSFLIPNVGQHDQLEVAGRVVCPMGEENGSSDSDSDRTVSFVHIPGDDHGDGTEVNSRHGKERDPDPRPDVQNHLKRTTLVRADQGKSVDHGFQNIIRIQGKGGFLKILPKNKLIMGTGGSILQKNIKMDGGCGDGKIVPTDAKTMAPLTRVQDRKEFLHLPQWLKEYKSMVADIDGWQNVQVARTDGSGRKDKFYTHRDYAHTFRSKKEVKHFLDTGEVKGKGLLQKKLADPVGQSYGARRSMKRRLILPENERIEKTTGRMEEGNMDEVQLEAGSSHVGLESTTNSIYVDGHDGKDLDYANIGSN